jgi:hypothetical protein
MNPIWSKPPTSNTKVSHVGGHVWKNNWLWSRWLDSLALQLQVLFITLITELSLIYTLSVHITQAPGFSIFTSHLLAMDLNTETSPSNHYEVFLPLLVQSPWNLRTQLKTLLHSDSCDLLLCYKPLALTPQKICVMCQIESSLVCYEHWAWCGWHRKHSFIYCCVT